MYMCVNVHIELKGPCQALEIAQWLRALDTVLGDPSSVPRIHAVQLTAPYNSSFRGPYTFFWPLEASACTWCTYIHSNTKINK